ncbi:MAG: hypothetical protein IJN92_04610 [Lachnospiraceae bacterium]|nr:hypothetical protein [Lachnospiraceae bacterium]
MIKIEIKDGKMALSFWGWIIFVFMVLSLFAESIFMNYQYFKMNKNRHEGFILEE